MTTFLFNYLHIIILGIASVLLYYHHKHPKRVLVICVTASILLLANQALIPQFKPSPPSKTNRHIYISASAAEFKDISLKPAFSTKEGQERVNTILGSREQVKQTPDN